MTPFKFRASSVGRIMADAQSIDASLLPPDLLAVNKKKVKTDAEKELLAPYKDRSLSAGAKTYIETLAKEFVYGFEQEVTGKYMEKGLAVEDQSIELYNSVFFADHRKNTERRENEWVTGECDIAGVDKIIDIKSSWSLATFPAFADAGRDADYEWQGRTYMWLWDKPAFEIAYCLVNTPDELLGHEDQQLHYVDHINPALRVTTVAYQRDAALEARIRLKVERARDYFDQIVKRIAAEHGG